MSEYTKNGGPWLGAVRSFLQSRFHNGSYVTWNSSDVLKPAATVRDFEEAAERAVNAAFKDIDRMQERIEELQKKLLGAQMGIKDE